MFTWNLPQKSPRRPFFATRLCAVVLYYERWRSLSVLASPTSLFSSWAPNYCWHGQEPGYNFTHLGCSPNQGNKTGFGPLALCTTVLRALKPVPGPAWPVLLSSWFSYGQGGREGKSRHRRLTPCVLLTLRHSSPRKCPGGGHGIGAPSSSAPDGGRCAALRCAGEKLVGIHSDSSMEPAVGTFLPGGAGVEKRGDGTSLTKDLEPQAGTFPSRFTLCMD